jgi:predicted RNase H-like nuclease
MAPGPGRRGGGPALPYRLVAGVEPCPGGWLVVSARLTGVTAFPQAPEVFAKFGDIVDYRPSFDVLAVHAPLSFPTKDMRGGRTCDREARKLLGFPHSGAIVSPPSRELLASPTKTKVAAARLSPVAAARLKWFAQVAEEMAPYRQRQVFEVHPELSFYQLNGDQPMAYSKYDERGVKERRDLLAAKLAGIEDVLDSELPGVTIQHLLDATADLWTSRRIAARAVDRLPEDPEWDDDGIRMELLR